MLSGLRNFAGRIIEGAQSAAGRLGKVIGALPEVAGYVLKGGPLDRFKTPLALILFVLTKSGIFPEVDFTDGLTLDEMTVIYVMIDNKLKELGVRKRSLDN